MKSAATNAKAAFRTGRGDVGLVGGRAASASWSSFPAVAAVTLSSLSRSLSNRISAFAPAVPASRRIAFSRRVFEVFRLDNSTARCRARNAAATALAVAAAAFGLEAEAEMPTILAFGSTVACTFAWSDPTDVRSLRALRASTSRVIRSF